MKIDNITGALTTTKEKTFDYEQQSVLILQIKAFDNLINEHSSIIHSVFTQVTVNIIDVNDKTPEIMLPRSTINIIENSIGLSLLTAEIEGRDPDSGANLTFSLNWNDSYATKSGQPTDRIDFENCFTIQTHKSVSVNLVYGHLIVNPLFSASKEIDYEKFDTIFVALKITDQNQEVNDNSSQLILSINIIDLNDNAPEFIENTLTEIRQVAEEAAIGTLIGTISAIDIDGVGNNNIVFSLK